MIDVAYYLHSEGGCCSYLAQIADDGSAEIWEVEFDDDDRPVDIDYIDDLEPYFWLDQDMLAVIEAGGDRAHGGDIESAVEAWLEVDFTAKEAEAWLEAGVFDADAAHELYRADVTPEQVDIAWEANGYHETLGYCYANRDVTLDEVKAVIEDEG